MGEGKGKNLKFEDITAVSVLVVGDVMLDRYWFGDVERISPEAPVPVVHVKREEFRPGGGANVATNVTALGAKATLMSVVGDDEPARRLSDLLSESGVRTVMRVDPALPTTVKLRVSGRSQQLIRIDFEQRPQAEVLAQLTAAFNEMVPSHDVVLLSDYGKGGLQHVSDMIALARAAGKPVLVDPKGSDFGPYRGATLLTPNRGELAAVVGAWRDEEELVRKAQALRADLNLDALLVTRSEEGMSLFDADGHFRVTAEAREVFDVTGAGDTVIGTLAALIGAGLSLREAVPVANRAGGLAVGKFGTATIGFEELFA